jgi:pimeloyl-ACP methyl ester carboxylesterase
MKELEKAAASPAGLSFRRSGSPGGAAILFLHGGGAGAWMWDPVVERLPEFDCLAPDLPEHGESRHIAPFSMKLAAHAVAELIRAHAPRGKGTVVGLSEGAQVSVQLLATAPDLVEAAILSSALLRPLPGARWLSSPGLLAWMYRLAVRPFRDRKSWIRLNMRYAAGIPEQYFDAFKKSFQGMSESGFVHMMAANQRFRLPDDLKNANAPVLALAGKHEYRAMKESVRDLIRVLPNAQAGWINLGKGSSRAREHNWALHAPEVFAQTVRGWIKETPLPGEIELF